MTRKFDSKTLLIASNNPGKVDEIKELLAPYNLEVISAKDLNVEEPEETGSTFSENAALKAAYYGRIANLPALSDDSGLSIDALGGFPGIHSARFAGPNRDFSQAFNLIEQKLHEKSLISSAASFICALALWWPDDYTSIFEGKIDGGISFPAKGDKGFGYSPIFTVNGYDQSFAEMDMKERNRISHRAQAFNKLIQACF
jgi:XTP/dITP diphosphohydrolase